MIMKATITLTELQLREILVEYLQKEGLGFVSHQDISFNVEYVKERTKPRVVLYGNIKMMYKRGLWVDDIRTPPEKFYYQGKPVHWDRAWDVEGAKQAIKEHEQYDYRYDLLSLDHDAGEYGPPDYIKLLDWLEETGRNYPIRIHSMNSVGVENMRRIIERNGWKEIK